MGMGKERFTEDMEKRAVQGGLIYCGQEEVVMKQSCCPSWYKDMKHCCNMCNMNITQ